MRILLVAHGYPPYGVAGVERVVQQTAISLSARGHAVTVLARRPSPAPPTLAIEREQLDGVDVVWVSGGGSTLGQYPGHEDAADGVFVRMLAELMPDVVVLSHLLHHSANYVRLAQRWGIPVAMELHDFFTACPLAHLQRSSGARCAGPEGGRACATHCFSDQADSLARWALRSAEFRGALRAADAVVCPSRFVADYFELFRGAGRPIQVLGNGVDLSSTPAAPAPPSDAGLQLATVGVVIDHKGQQVVVDAVKNAALPSVRYTLLGMTVKDYAADLRRIADLVPGFQLRMYGRFEPAQLPALLGGVHAVVIPSLVWETYSIAAREALACGVPVIASRLGALPEAVRDGDNGLLFTPGDDVDLARVLRRLVDEPELLPRLRAGIRAGDWLTVDARSDELEALLAELVDQGAADPRDRPALASVRSVFDPS